MKTKRFYVAVYVKHPSGHFMHDGDLMSRDNAYAHLDRVAQEIANAADGPGLVRIGESSAIVRARDVFAIEVREEVPE